MKGAVQFAVPNSDAFKSSEGLLVIARAKYKGEQEIIFGLTGRRLKFKTYVHSENYFLLYA